MSAKDMLYGIVSAVVPNCTGLDGGTYTGYLVDVNLFTDPLLGNSIKATTFSVGDVVTIIQCGETLAFGGTDVPLHGWAFAEYSFSYPSVYQVPNAAIAREICLDPRYSASVSMNWLCRHSGAIDSLYWPGRITAISGSIVTVCDQFGLGAYQMPVSADMSVGDFSVGDYVLVYSPSSGEQIIGWWLMEPGESSLTVSITHTPLVAGYVGTFTVSIANTGTRALYSVDTNISYLAGSLSNLSDTTWAAGTIARGETKTKEITATAGGSISVPDGWMTAEVTTSEGLTGTTTKVFAIQQATVYAFAQGGDTLGLYCSPPGSSHYANAIVASGGGNIVVVYSEDGGSGEHILTMEGSYDTIYTTSITGSVTSYTATATIGSDEGPTYTVVFTMDLSNGDISLGVSIT